MIQNKVSFSKSVGFRKELNRRVEAYFEERKLSQRDNFAMYLKTATLVVWMLAAWLFILFAPVAGWLKLLGCVVLALGMAGFAFNVGHDANHGGYSSNRYINKALGLTYDLIGISSYLWRYRHNTLHHTYTNIVGHDVEIDGDGLARMAPDRELKWFHSFQHIYIWFVYTLIPFYWSFSDVYLILFKRKYHEHKIPTPSPLELFTLLGSKVVWLGIGIGIPLAVGYTPLQAALGFCFTYMTYGVVICTVFMVAHVVEKAEFLTPAPETGNIDDEWAICQVRTTADFAPNNKFLTWYLGGLNFQVIHHLFPQICHIHYPKLAPIFQEVCQEYGVNYIVYPTFTEAIASNYRWLKAMGQPEISPASPMSVSS